MVQFFCFITSNEFYFNLNLTRLIDKTAFYRIRYEELENELEELAQVRNEMNKKFDDYIDDVQKVIYRQERDAPYIKR